MEKLILGLEWYVAFIFSIVLHEAAHAFVAMKLGDRTAYYGGQVTLDPGPHIRREPIGTVVVPILSFALGGWMIGWASAPYDPLWAARHPRRSAWMAFAGPAANLLLVVGAGLIIRGGMLVGLFDAPDSIGFTRVAEASGGRIAEGVAELVSILFTLNLVLLVFNLIPLPPLDGSGMIPLFVNPRVAAGYREFLSQPGISLIGLLVAWRLFPRIFGPVHIFAVNLLYPDIGYG